MASLQRKIVKGHEYWSLVESKRINGKPTPIVLEYYGNTKKFAEKLLNGDYNNKILKSYSHGDTYALYKIARKLEIEDILDDVFKKKKRKSLKRSESIIMAAIQNACSPGSKNELANWFQTTTLPIEMGIKPNILTSQHFWDQMDDITEDELSRAETLIVKRIFELYDFELEKIALDYTNYFSYIDSSNDKNTIARRGKNKQKRNDLRQYSLALVTTKETHLPLCTHIYEGNVNDQTEFFQFVNLLEKRLPDYDPKSITLIFDGGSNNKKNFNMLDTHYICSFSLSSCKELYEIDIKDYTELRINGKCVKNYRITKEIWGAQRECILTFSNGLFGGQLKELSKNIQVVINNIEELNEKLRNPKSKISKSKGDIENKLKSILKKPYMKDIFKIQVNGSETIKDIEFVIDDDVKAEVINKYFGKKLIISDRNDWSSFEIIKAYREQDCIEKIFKDTKDMEHFSIRPQYHYTDQKIRVHIFCCLLGLTLTTILHKEVSNNNCKISKERLLENLKQIRQCFIKDKTGNKVNKTLEEMNELQSVLWNAVNNI